MDLTSVSFLGIRIIRQAIIRRRRRILMITALGKRGHDLPGYLANSSEFNTKKIPIFTYLGLSFIWPFKKANGKNNVKAVSQNCTLEKADLLFETGHYDECYQMLTNHEEVKDEPEVEVQWRLCRLLYNMSKDHNDEIHKKDLTLQAYQLIDIQLEKNLDHFAVHKWYALLLDAKSSLEGIKERIIQLENVKKHMDLAVSLNPNDATTLHMLGEWCFQVAKLPWYHRKIAEVMFASPPVSTYEDALEYFLRAEQAQPRFYGANLLRIGICYMKLNMDDQAKYYLKLAAVYPAKTNDDHLTNKEAAELLKKLK